MKTRSDTCDLCGLPLCSPPFTLTGSEQTFSFCCLGCRQVFNLLLEADDTTDPSAFKKTDLFKKCREIGIIPRSEKEPAQRRYAPDNPASDGTLSEKSKLLKKVERVGRVLNLKLKIDDMWCPACAWIIEAVLKKSPGIVSASCNFSTDAFRCDYDPITTTPDRILEAITALGYRANPFGENGASAKRDDVIRFGVSVFFSANVMMLSLALYTGFFNRLSADTIQKLSWPIFFMTAIVFFYGGYNIYKKTLAGFFTAAFGMETLITVGTASTFLFSIVNFLKGNIHVYFDTTCMLITLVLLGKLLEKNARHKIQVDLENFFSLRPTKVKICSEKFPQGRYMSARRLQPGDVFKLEENETVAADGLVLQGSGAIDESALTGEALPVKKKAGDRVRSGTKVLRGSFQVQAESVGDNSTIGQMIRIMEAALENKTPFEGKTDRMLLWFVPAIVLLASATGAGCLLYGLSIETALIRAVTVLVIACPCSLGIAIPLVRVAGISMAAKDGILVRNFSAIEQADHITAFVFDKTGTITHGHWTLLDIIAFAPFTKDQILSLAVSLEKDSDHYIATEIRQQARKHNIKPKPMDRIIHYENGISGYDQNAEVKIGAKDFLLTAVETAPISLLNDTTLESPMNSYIYMSFGGRPCAVIIFGDKIKTGAFETIEQLKSKGHSTYLLSGDGDKTTKTVGNTLGIPESYGGKLPLEKSYFIKKLQHAGLQVAMAGDGINDASALIQADLSMAVYSGSHLGKEVADITLMRSDPLQIIDFLKLARRVNTKIFQNLAFSFLYNVLSIPIAMSGLLNPLIAVSAMLLSSLSVIGNTLLMIRKDTNIATDLSGESSS